MSSIKDKEGASRQRTHVVDGSADRVDSDHEHSVGARQLVVGRIAVDLHVGLQDIATIIERRAHKRAKDPTRHSGVDEEGDPEAPAQAVWS